MTTRENDLSIELFVCSHCHSNLRIVNPDLVQCFQCSRLFEVEDGIIIFSEEGDPEDLQEMRELVELSNTQLAQDEEPSLLFRLPNRKTTVARIKSEAKAFKFLEQLDLDLSALKILNISCGIGREAANLVEKGARDLTLVDISKPAVKKARSNFSKVYPSLLMNFAVCDANHLPFKADSFDLILIYGSAHHYGNLENFLSEATRVSHRLCVLSEPAGIYFENFIINTLGLNTEYGGIETHRINEEEILRFCEQNDLQYQSLRNNQYFPKILDSVGNVAIVFWFWFSFLRFLDFILPDKMKHSLNFYVSNK